MTRCKKNISNNAKFYSNWRKCIRLNIHNRNRRAARICGERGAMKEIGTPVNFTAALCKCVRYLEYLYF